MKTETITKSFITLLLFTLFYVNASSQALPCNCPVPPKRPERYPYNEIGISAGALYSSDHKEWGATAHIHYFRAISPYSSWSLGGGVEHAQLDGSHWTFAAGIKYELFDHFSFSVLPGVKFLNHDYSDNNNMTGNTEPEKKTLFSLHFEVVYDLFHWERFHLGPAIDYAWAKNHSHFMVGIHGAFSF